MHTLVLTAHPDLSSSLINSLWFEALSDAGNVTTRDLTAIGGPAMRFDPAAEQALYDHYRTAAGIDHRWQHRLGLRVEG